MANSFATLPGQDTLAACWTTLALTSPGAEVIRGATTITAVFPSWAPLNNAILSTGVSSAAESVIDELAVRYRGAGVDAWALWLPSRATSLDAPDVVPDLEQLSRDTTTLVMQATLGPGLRRHPDVVQTSLASIIDNSDERPVPVGALGEPERLPGLSAWAMVHEGVVVTSAWTFLHEGDCGVYAVETLSPWRRRGFARVLMEHLLADARSHGARSASLQSTRMGQPLYASLGFAPAGRYEEWTWQRSGTD